MKARGNLRRMRLAALGCLAIGLIGTASAQASIPLSGAVARPLDTTEQNATSHFHLHLNLGGSEHIKDFRTELAPGIGNDLSHPLCSPAAFKQDACPANSRVGSTTVNVSIGGIVPQDISGRLYYVDQDLAAGFVLPGIGIILDSPPPAPKAYQRGRTEIDQKRGGTSNVVENFPTSSGGLIDLPLRINSLDIVLNPDFYRNPPTCREATSNFIVTSYEDPGNPTEVSDSFLPTGCAPRELPTCAKRQATIVGTNRSDHLKGTRGRDVIVGLGGNDTIRGLGGNDIICGNRGNDRLIGARGRDLLVGGAGRDVLLGGPGRDRLYGGPGRDRQRQ